MTTRLLGASWELRKYPRLCLEQFIFRTKLSYDEAKFVYHFVAEEGYSHDEFQKFLATQDKIPA